MKKFFVFLFTVMLLFVALGAFTVTASAENEESQSFEVNAVEYEDEEQAVNTDNDIDNKTDLISEKESEAASDLAESGQPVNLNNPSTGVILAVVPAAIALAVLIALLIFGKINKNKGKGNRSSKDRRK